MSDEKTCEDIDLGAEQIRWMDEINLDEMANDKMLEVALGFYRNRQNELGKEKKKWWDEAASVYGFDLGERVWVFKRWQNRCVLRPKDRDDLNE